ncbi:MAG TPA: VWA domain-containing protein, partial [Pyrinomonadaceae bacterium]|nr:VWA domain-containing protein [Pyrinomonadaceae bacterium]
QQTPTPSPSPTPAEGEESGEDETVTVDVSEIKLQVRVIDRNNRTVGDVQQSDFRVFEDGVPQTVTYFSKEEVPIQYGLLIDNSGSLRAQLPKVIEASRTIVNSNKQQDETLLVRFTGSEQIEIVQDFTANKDEMLEAIETLYTEGGQTAILDAIYVTAEHVAQYKKGPSLNDRRRRALILVTDGEERGSTYRQERLFEMLRENDVQIYVIGFVNELDHEGGFIRKSPRTKAVNLINRLAEETGGRAFFPTSLNELPQIAEEITRDLRTQYVLGYNPTNKARDGRFRAVRVTIADAPGREKRIALTRAGYTAQGGAPSSSAPSQKDDKPTSLQQRRP